MYKEIETSYESISYQVCALTAVDNVEESVPDGPLFAVEVID